MGLENFRLLALIVLHLKKPVLITQEIEKIRELPVLTFAKGIIHNNLQQTSNELTVEPPELVIMANPRYCDQCLLFILGKIITSVVGKAAI